MSLCNKLDPPSGPWRHDLTETLLEQFSGTELWDEFGIDEDIVVRISYLSRKVSYSCHFSPLHATSLVPTSMN